MILTLAELKTRARQTSDQEGSNFVSEPELTSIINSALGEYWDLMVLRYEDYYLLDTILPVVDGKVSLPEDFIKLRGVDQDLGGSFRPLDPYQFHERNDHFSTPRYRLIADHVSILGSVNQVKLYYIPTFNRLVEDTDTFSFQANGDELVVVSAAIQMLSKEESSTTHLERRAEDLKKRIQTAASNRDTTPQTIQDTASRRGRWP